MTGTNATAEEEAKSDAIAAALLAKPTYDMSSLTIINVRTVTPCHSTSQPR